MMIKSMGTLMHGMNYFKHLSVGHTFHTSSFMQLDQDWRAKEKLTKNPNTFGALTNLPDYSFKDGRPTPYGIRQKNRMDEHKKYAKTIIELVKQVDYAVERHARLQQEEQDRRKAILDSKLKPKGNLHLKDH